MHKIIIEIREKGCVHVHHLEISTQEWKNGNNCQPLYREYMKGDGGSGGRQPPRSQWNEEMSKKIEDSPFR